MVALPKPVKWVTQDRALDIIMEKTGTSLDDANDALVRIAAEGVVKTRRIVFDVDPFELAPDYWMDDARIDRDGGFEFHRSELMRWLHPDDDKPRRGLGRTPKLKAPRGIEHKAFAAWYSDRAREAKEDDRSSREEDHAAAVAHFNCAIPWEWVKEARRELPKDHPYRTKGRRRVK